MGKEASTVLYWSMVLDKRLQIWSAAQAEMANRELRLRSERIGGVASAKDQRKLTCRWTRVDDYRPCSRYPSDVMLNPPVA